MIRRLLVLLCVAISCQVNAQTQLASKVQPVKEFVLEVPRMDFYKRLPEFKQHLLENPEIEFAGFCESRGLLMLKMPETDLEFIARTLQNMDLVYYVKLKATVQQAIHSCEYKEEIEISKTSN